MGYMNYGIWLLRRSSDRTSYSKLSGLGYVLSISCTRATNGDMVSRSYLRTRGMKPSSRSRGTVLCLTKNVSFLFRLCVLQSHSMPLPVMIPPSKQPGIISSFDITTLYLLLTYLTIIRHIFSDREEYENSSLSMICAQSNIILSAYYTVRSSNSRAGNVAYTLFS